MFFQVYHLPPLTEGFDKFNDNLAKCTTSMKMKGSDSKMPEELKRLDFKSYVSLYIRARAAHT